MWFSSVKCLFAHDFFEAGYFSAVHWLPNTKLQLAASWWTVEHSVAKEQTKKLLRLNECI